MGDIISLLGILGRECFGKIEDLELGAIHAIGIKQYSF
jgi:hypothetical protein